MKRPRHPIGQIADLDLRLLRVFRAVVECGGFAAAGLMLDVGRSTISSHMSELESRIGMRLCRRGRAGFELTSSGRQIYEETLKVLTAIDELRTRINRVGQRVSGELCLGLVDNVIWDRQFGWSSAFKRFAHAAPDVQLTLQILSPDAIERQVLDGHIHVGVLPPMRRLPGLCYQPLFEERSLLYCGSGHPLFGVPAEQITEGELAKHNYVRKGYPVNDLLGLANEKFRSSAAAYHVEAIALLILSDAYIGFLPEHYAANWTRLNRLRALRPDIYSATTAFHALYRRTVDLSPAAELLLDVLSESPGEIAATETNGADTASAAAIPPTRSATKRPAKSN